MRNFLTILFYLLFLLYPLQLVGRMKVFQNVYVTPQDLVVLTIFVVAIIYRLLNKKKLRTDRFLKYQLFFVLFGTASLVLNVFAFHDINLLVSMLYMARYVIYLNLLTMSQLWGYIKNAQAVIILSGGIVLVVGFIQFFFYNNLQNLFYLGWDNHLYRLFSSFLDPNYAGVFFAIYFFFLLSFVLQKPLKSVYPQLVIAFFTLVALYITYSRTALVTLIAGAVSFGVVKKKVKLMLIFLILLIFLLFLTSDTSVEGLNPLRTASTSERIKSMKEAGGIFLQNPLYGVGFNAFRYVQIRTGIRNSVGSAVSNSDAGTDNSYLFVLATTGIIGFSIFVLSYYFLLKMLWEERGLIGYGLFCIMVAVLVGSLFLNVLFYTPILTYLFVLISLRKNIFTTRGT